MHILTTRMTHEKTVLPKILLVDDEESATCCLQMYLKKLGFIVDTAKDGVEALTKLAHGRFRWLISDVKMPGMCGLELTRKAKAMDTNLEIILMSAFINEEQFKQVCESNMSFFEKPLDLNALGQFLIEGTSDDAEDSGIKGGLSAEEEARASA